MSARETFLERYGDAQGESGRTYTNFVELFVAMKELDPNATIFDLAFQVKKLVDLELTDLLTEEESRVLLPLIGDTEIAADSVFEGLGAFP